MASIRTSKDSRFTKRSLPFNSVMIYFQPEFPRCHVHVVCFSSRRSVEFWRVAGCQPLCASLPVWTWTGNSQHRLQFLIHHFCFWMSGRAGNCYMTEGVFLILFFPALFLAIDSITFHHMRSNCWMNEWLTFPLQIDLLQLLPIVFDLLADPCELIHGRGGARSVVARSIATPICCIWYLRVLFF